MAESQPTQGEIQQAALVRLMHMASVEPPADVTAAEVAHVTAMLADAVLALVVTLAPASFEPTVEPETVQVGYL
jgi:restriction endonuclease Mrr